MQVAEQGNVVNRCDNFYTISEVGEMIRAKRSKMFGLIRDGKLNAFKIGSYNYVRQSEIDRFIRENVKPSRRVA